MDVNPRLLTIRLMKEVGFEISCQKQKSKSDDTLETIYESFGTSISSCDNESIDIENPASLLRENRQSPNEEEKEDILYDNDNNENDHDNDEFFIQDISYHSSSNLEWAQTKNEAFEQLRILDQLASVKKYKKDTVQLEKRVVLRAFESQLRRRIFQLQRDHEGGFPSSI